MCVIAAASCRSYCKLIGPSTMHEKKKNVAMSEFVPGALQKQPRPLRYPAKRLLSIRAIFPWRLEKQTQIIQDRVRKYNEHPFMPVPVKYFRSKKQEDHFIGLHS